MIHHISTPFLYALIFLLLRDSFFSQGFDHYFGIIAINSSDILRLF